MEKLSLDEQEVVINFSRADELATFYSSDVTWIKKMDKLCEEYPNEYKCISESKIGGEVVGKTYSFPKKLVSPRKPSTKREVSEEVRQARINNLQKSKKTAKTE